MAEFSPPQSSPPSKPQGPPTPLGRANAAPPGRRPRSWLIPAILIVAAGAGGYFIGRPSGTASTQAGQYAGQGGQYAGGAGTGSRNGSGRSGASGRSGFNRGSGAVIAVTATAAKSGTLTTTRTSTGTVTAVRTSPVTTRAAGTISSVDVAVGQTVRSGQELLTLSSTDLTTAVSSAENALSTAQVQLITQTNTVNAAKVQLQQQVASAQAALQSAQTAYTGNQQLYAIGGIARTTLDTSASAVQSAKSTLSTAQNALDTNNRSQSESLRALELAVQRAQLTVKQAQDAQTSANITAPFNGQVSAVSVANGEYVNAGTAAVTVVSSDRQVTFSVPPSESGGFKDGQALKFLAGQSSYPLKVVQNSGAPTNGNVQVAARFSGDSTPALGTAGAVQYTSTVGSGTLIPSTSLQADNTDTTVFVINEGKAVQTKVNVIGQAGTQAVVTGIDDGDQVITQPPSGLLNNAKVTTDVASQRAGGGQGSQNGQSRQGGQGGPPAGGAGGAP